MDMGLVWRCEMAIKKNGQSLLGVLILQLASLAVVACSLWLAASVFSSLPQTFAVHYDLLGAPNGWMTKSWLGVLQLWFIQLGVFLLLAGMTFWIIVSPRSLGYLNLPGIDRERLLRLPDEERERVRWLAASFMSLIDFFVLLFIGYIDYDILRSAIVGKSPSDGMILIATILLLVCVFAAIGWLAGSAKQILQQYESGLTSLK